MLYNYERSVFARFTFFRFFKCMPTFLSSPCMYAIQKDFVMLNNVQKNSASSLKIAIVLPVYNVALYLEECLQSIFSQSYENFTVFAVNDGSTDTSGTILAKYKNTIVTTMLHLLTATIDLLLFFFKGLFQLQHHQKPTLSSAEWIVSMSTALSNRMTFPTQ